VRPTIKLSAKLTQVIRATGSGQLEDAEAVVLEPNGKLSVIKKSEGMAGHH
jgi:uncharacterized membrane protein YcaP (DUF421 family)